jgi:phage tail protein X
MQYNEYRCKQCDVLDAICYQHYGSANMTESVLEYNAGLSDYGTHLPLGLLIRLPVVTQSAVSVMQTVSLWD